MLKCLQAGRATAALVVLAFHLSTAFADPRYGGKAVGEVFTSHGSLGVDFFFVLSGFIILNAHAKDIGRPERWTTYLWRRFARVYPIYWIYLGVFCGLLAMGVGHFAQPPVGQRAWIAAFSLIPVSSDELPLSVAWTLFHEIAFYALFSLLILNRWLGVVSLAAWAVICVARYHETGESGYSAWQVYTSAFNLEFFFGMAAYGLYRRGRNPALLAAVGATMVTAACGLMLSYDRVEHDLFGAGFALVIAAAAITESQGRLRTPPILVALGGASYSLYLIHIPVMCAVLKVMRFQDLATGLPPALVWWLVAAATAAVSYLAWILLERPLQRRLRDAVMVQSQRP